MNNEASSSKSRDLLSAREAITLTRKDSHSRSAVDSRTDHERVSIHWESQARLTHSIKHSGLSVLRTLTYRPCPASVRLKPVSLGIHSNKT